MAKEKTVGGGSGGGGSGGDAATVAVVERAALLIASAAANVVGSKMEIPILANMLVEADGEALALTATNLDIEVRVTAPARVEGGRIATTVAAKKLAGLVSGAEDGCQIALSHGGGDAGGGRMKVKAGRGRYQLPVLPAQDFPRMEFADGGPVLSMEARELATALGRTAFAEETSEARYYLNGTCLAPVDGRLFAVATNGHVISEVELSDAPEGWDAAILPSRLTALLIRLLKDSDEALTVTRDRGGERLRFEWGAWCVTAKLVQGNFPDWRRAMAQPRPEREIVVDSGTLQQAVRRVGQVQDEKSKLVILTVGKDRLTISCDSPQYGHGEEEVPASGDVDGFSIGVNAAYLRDLAAAASGDTIVIDLPEEAGGRLRIVPAARSGFDSTMMPISI